MDEQKRGGSKSNNSIRVETRSLLGNHGSSNSTLKNITLSTNARAAAALDCDGSLSDESGEPFVLANPVILARERDAVTMPPPRPSRRRKMSPEKETPVRNFFPALDDPATASTSHALNLAPAASAATEGRTKSLSLDGGDEMPDPLATGVSSAQQPGIRFKPASSTANRYDHKYSDRLQSIESCCSLVGLGLAGASSMVAPGCNKEPETPKLASTNNSSYTDYLALSPESKSSVRISRSDADNVNLTIASMMALNQSSPNVTTCRS